MKVGKGLLSIISMLGGATVGALGMNRVMKKSVNVVQNKSDKYWTLFVMMNQWVRIKQGGKKLSDYFEKYGYKKIAIYGMGYAGETLLSELKDSNIEIAYGIDRNADKILLDIDILSLEDNLPGVDVIVVTAVTYFEEVEEALSKRTDSKIISLDNMLYEI